MEKLDRIATHDGVVTAVKPGKVEVHIEAVSACASCQAHSRCGFAESKTKTVEIPESQWQAYASGDKVQVAIDEEHGLLAVWIAYVLPALLMLATIIGLSLTGLPEWAVILIALAALGVYVGLLFLLRGRIASRFVLTVNKC